MPARSTPGRRARSRKRRASTGGVPAPIAAPSSEWRRQVGAARTRVAAERPERPRPPWHPVPLAELLILFGAIAFFVGMARDPAGPGRTSLLAGVAAVAIGTVEFSLREHRSGFRSHAVLLALLPAIALHTGVIAIAGAVTHVSRTMNYALFAVDALVVVALALWLRRGHRRAREAHTLGLP